MKDKRINYLLKTIIIFVWYMFNANIFNAVFNLIGFNNNTISMLIGDLFFLIFIVFIYKKNLKTKMDIFKKDYSTKGKVWQISKWILIILLVNAVMGILTEIFYPELASGIDENAYEVTKLFDVSFLYFAFKTLLFAPIAEELIFKESIRDVVKNDVAFILISSAIYTVMNVMYASNGIQWLDLFGYFVLSLILSLAYVKNKDNIIIVIFIKFFYNLFPTLILISTMIEMG